MYRLLLVICFVSFSISCLSIASAKADESFKGDIALNESANIEPEPVIDNLTVSDNVSANAADEKALVPLDKSLMLGNIFLDNVSKINVILVDKNKKVMYVVGADGSSFDILGEYPIITGINDGNKMVQGDGKTPEGVYYIVSHRPSAELIKAYGNYAKIYGAGSMPLSYPNKLDKLKRKTGGGIWIHGRDPINGKSTTQGCVALHNEDFDNVTPNGPIKTPVVISENLDYLSKENYDKKRADIFNLFYGFISSWANSDKEAFKSYIHERYLSGAVNAKSYYANKKALMDAYPERVILNDNTKIFLGDNESFLVDTDQFYCAANLTTYGNKRHYFMKDKSGEYKLASEEFSPKDSSELIKSEIDKFINSWLSSWRNKQIDGYIGFYDKKFRNGKMDINAWYEYKKGVFEKSGDVSIKISDIKWSKTASGYSVTFTQVYSSSSTNDRGLKTLELSGCPSAFKIISETWKAQ